MATAVDLSTQVAEAQRSYVERNPESQRLHEERARFMPGGNTRTVIHVHPFPLTIVRGEGGHIVDADGCGGVRRRKLGHAGAAVALAQLVPGTMKVPGTL